MGKERMAIENDVFDRFSNIHTGLEPHYLWKLAVKYPKYLEKNLFILNYCVNTCPSDNQVYVINADMFMLM